MNTVKTFVKDIFTPNKQLGHNRQLVVLTIWVATVLIYWTFSSTKLLPSIPNIWEATKTLFANGFMGELLSSIWLCAKGMFWATIISLLIAYASVMPFFRPFTAFVGKARFMTTIGLTFLFALICQDTTSQKVSLLVFGITVFHVTSISAIISSVTKAELDYARTLKKSEWETVWEVIILGKADLVLDVIRQNFAIAWMMLAMVENLCRSEGGIGVILNDQNKVFHLDAVYSIQIMILLLGMFFDWMLGFIRKTLCPYAYITLERK